MKFRSGDYDQAFTLFYNLSAADETDHRAWNALGVTCIKLGMRDDAIICFDNALSLDPHNQVYIKNREKFQSKILSTGSVGYPVDTKSPSIRSKFPVKMKRAACVLGIMGIILISFTIIYGHLSDSEQQNALNQASPAILNSIPVSAPDIVTGKILGETENIHVSSPTGSRVSLVGAASSMFGGGHDPSGIVTAPGIASEMTDPLPLMDSQNDLGLDIQSSRLALPAISATRTINNLVVTNNGGQDIGIVEGLLVRWPDGTDEPLNPVPGSSVSNADSGSSAHITVVATMKDETTRVVFDGMV